MEGSPRWSPTLKEEAGMSRAVLGNPAPSSPFPIAIGPEASPFHFCAEFS